MFCEIEVIAEIYRRYQLDDIYNLCFSDYNLPSEERPKT